MENRHLRALSKRVVNGQAVSTQLVAWAKQHIEWTLRDGSALNPDGVLMIVLDEKGQAAMTVGPYEPIDSPTAATLADRAIESAREAEETGVAPETLGLPAGIPSFVAWVPQKTRQARSRLCVTSPIRLGLP
jgi:hypothetical protein